MTFDKQNLLIELLSHDAISKLFTSGSFSKSRKLRLVQQRRPRFRINKRNDGLEFYNINFALLGQQIQSRIGLNFK